jgi:hypothetical protein
MKRNPAPKENLVKGKSSYFPFLPGGLDPTDLISKKQLHANDDVFPLENDQLLTIPAGMERGLAIHDSDKKKITNVSNVVDLDLNNDFLQELLQDECKDEIVEEKEMAQVEIKAGELTPVRADGQEAQLVDELIPVLVRYLL